MSDIPNKKITPTFERVKKLCSYGTEMTGDEQRKNVKTDTLQKINRKGEKMKAKKKMV